MDQKKIQFSSSLCITTSDPPPQGLLSSTSRLEPFLIIVKYTNSFVYDVKQRLAEDI